MSAWLVSKFDQNAPPRIEEGSILPESSLIAALSCLHCLGLVGTQTIGASSVVFQSSRSFSITLLNSEMEYVLKYPQNTLCVGNDEVIKLVIVLRNHKFNIFDCNFSVFRQILFKFEEECKVSPIGDGVGRHVCKFKLGVSQQRNLTGWYKAVQ